MWVVGPRTGYAYSWEDKEFVNFPSKWGALHGPEIAHESGHYLHLWHTHGPAPKTVDEAAKDIKDYVNQKAGGDVSRGLEVFDPDRASGVNDTPPDPGPNFYAAVAGALGNACTVNVSPHVPVDFGGGKKHTYNIATDRGDVMSYFKDCSTFEQHFSPDQVKRMRAALDHGNRRRLVGTQLGDTKWPHLRYSALWNADQYGCVWWPLCTEAELRLKTSELWGSMRLKQMTGFVIDGQVRFSCIWTPGTYGQVWWPNCSDKQFRDKTSELWGSMRPSHLNAYKLADQVRFSAIWRPSTRAQVWWPLCTEEQVRQKTDDIWSSMRPVLWMQAIV
jgi:hypothetical protein